MKQIQKLDSLIKKIIKEELDEYGGDNRPTTYAGRTNMATIKASPSYKALKPETQKKVDQELAQGRSVTLENEKEMQDTQLEPVPTGTEIAGQVSEIVDKLKTMAEAKEDPKKQKLVVKAMKQMESAKAALEALTAHEMMLEEKAQAEEEKEAEKHVKGFKKHLTKLVKEPAAVEKIASKMDAKKMAELKKKIKSGELDEEKLARVMLQHSLKEGWIK